MAAKKPTSKARVGKKVPRRKDRGTEGDYRVFISHVEKDKDLARSFAQEVRSCGAEPLVSVPKAGSRSSSSQLHKALEQSDEVAVLLSERSMEDTSTLFVLGAATGLHRATTLILIDLGSRDLSGLLTRFPTFRYSDRQRYLAKLEERAATASHAARLVVAT